MADTLTWTKFVRKYAEQNNVTYHAALKAAGPAWQTYKEQHNIPSRVPKAKVAKAEAGPMEEPIADKPKATPKKPRAPRKSKAQKQQEELERLRLQVELANLRLSEKKGKSKAKVPVKGRKKVEESESEESD